MRLKSALEVFFPPARSQGSTDLEPGSGTSRSSGNLDAARTAELYRTYGPVIFARCVRLLGDRAAAEDATQETFMRVQKHLHKAPDGRQALAWIYRIATNYCLNEIRNRKLRPEPVAELPERASRHQETAMVDRDYVSRLIDRVPAKLRVCAWLHFVDGMDQQEVAETLGVSRRTVFTYLEKFSEVADRFAVRAEA